MAVVSLASGEDLAQLQLDYPVVGLVVQAKLKGEKPLQSETKALGRPIQIWDKLSLKDGQLYRQFLDPHKHLQLVVPQCKQDEVLREMHEGSMGGHLGEEKTLARVRGRFYWPGYHDQVSNYCK